MLSNGKKLKNDSGVKMFVTHQPHQPSALCFCRTSDFLMKVESLLVSIPQKEPRRDITFSEVEHSVLRILPKTDGPAYEIVAILDPTTRAAQKYTPVIMAS